MIRLMQLTRDVARREMERLKRDRQILFLTFGIPLIVFPLVAGIYLHGVVREIPVAVFDGDRSELSRLIVRSLDASSTFRVAEGMESVDEIRSAFRKGTICAGFVIPEGLERRLKRGEKSEVVVFNDASNLILANMTLKEASTVLGTVSAGAAVKQLRGRGMTEREALASVMPVRVHAQALYNPVYNYADYLVSGLVPALFQVVVMAVAVLLIAGEVADGTFAGLIRCAGGSVPAMVFGKAAPLMVAHAGVAAAILWILYPVFHVNVAGSTAAVFVLYLLFVTASLAMGLLVSSIAHERMFATEVVLFLTIPAFIMSGYIFPTRAMPLPYVAFAHLLPYTSFLQGYVAVGRMGLPLSSAAAEVGTLILFTVLCTAGTVMMLRKRIRALKNSEPGMEAEL